MHNDNPEYQSAGRTLPDLPDWIVDVPMEVSDATPVDFGDGNTISAQLLVDALRTDVGTTITSMSIAAELAQAMAEFTERGGWKKLPEKPTSVTRVSEDLWRVLVGSFVGWFGKDEIETRLVSAFGYGPEE